MTQLCEISAEETARFGFDGYVVPDAVLPEPIVRWLRGEIDTLLRANPDVRPEHFVLPRSNRPEANPYAVTGHEPLNDFADMPMFEAIAERLLDDSVRVWGAQVFCKPAASGFGVPWHQDGYYWPIRPLTACSIWIAIDASTRTNGCMRVVPGSHRPRIIHPHVEFADNRKGFPRQVEPRHADARRAIDIELAPGQFSIHDPYLVHGSASNSSPLRRAGFVIRFMARSARFVAPGV